MSENLFSIRNQAGPLADDMFVKRWSPRSMVKGEVPDQDLLKMIDAARWSPSCFNDQPWHFVFSTDATYDLFLDLLVDANKLWCKNASRIGFVLARKNFMHSGENNFFAHFEYRRSLDGVCPPSICSRLCYAWSWRNS
ncbi:MAG: nitroreductase family protein [Bdellovibrionota bacterium]